MTEILPKLWILLTTKGRLEYAERTVAAIKEKLPYPRRAWVVVDGDGGNKNRLTHYLGNEQVIYYSSHDTPGNNWNVGVKKIYEQSDIYLRLEDDFELREELDIRHFVKVLETNQDVGMIRMGLMPIDLDLFSRGYQGRIYFEVLKNRSYTFSGNPGLIHKRFHNAYGYYHPTAGPGDCEVAMDNQVRAKDGPMIWWPMEIGGYGTGGPFDHIGEVQSY